MKTYEEAENSWAFYGADKASNKVESTVFSCLYAIPKAVYYTRKGKYKEAAYEGVKVAAGVVWGATGGFALALTLDLASDAAGSETFWGVLLDMYYGQPAPRIPDKSPKDDPEFMDRLRAAQMAASRWYR